MGLLVYLIFASFGHLVAVIYAMQLLCRSRVAFVSPYISRRMARKDPPKWGDFDPLLIKSPQFTNVSTHDRRTRIMNGTAVYDKQPSEKKSSRTLCRERSCAFMREWTHKLRQTHLHDSPSIQQGSRDSENRASHVCELPSATSRRGALSIRRSEGLLLFPER